MANYAQLRDTLTLFKPFLSPRCKFTWSSELEEAFQVSKRVIVDAITHGVQIFDMKRKTCLRPDWSSQGIGYFLPQQHCSCSSDLPDRCPGGWRITLDGSRFLTSAEQRCAAVDGKALAVAWGLKQNRYFSQGCNDLIVVTDHKPLIKIFGDRTLDEITNTRLFRLKQRTPWWFKIQHLPGKTNLAADATSRYPSTSDLANSTELNVQDFVEVVLMAAIRQEADSCHQSMGYIPWSLMAQETEKNASYHRLLSMIEDGSWTNRSGDASAAQFRRIFDSLYVEDGVILYQDRVVVPPTLRHRVLAHLHAAHQGTSLMETARSHHCVLARHDSRYPGYPRPLHCLQPECLVTG